MSEEKKIAWTDCIVNGELPDQETFTKEEMEFLMKTVMTWVSLQMEHELEEVEHKDIPELVRECEYKTIEDGCKDIQEGMLGQLGGLPEFFRTWFGDDAADNKYGILSPIQREDL